MANFKDAQTADTTSPAGVKRRLQRCLQLHSQASRPRSGPRPMAAEAEATSQLRADRAHSKMASRRH
ncbi:hypothetical protein NDU88_008582 [Pleurodeles waltl]|uniref:Uncharacterized protein n=1 Tax=Pleurodeles waltl TaxID=8319 RepID=A0AAV7N5E5_PLEWA|nr:hypothetical protein NDU88_008582 [Pleurodeles waltl]